MDGTLGGGSYAEAVLVKSAPTGRLFALDVDKDAISASRERLKAFEDRTMIVHGSYADIALHASKWNVRFDGAVLDLGVSSYQLDEPSRGFSFSKNGPLDMRMDVSGSETAADLVNTLSGEELCELFQDFGEERFARKIAERIISARKSGPIKTTKEIEEICYLSYPPKLRHMRVHPATRVFQALRIAVNLELDNLTEFINAAPDILSNGGKMVIVSYHSLEDRIVKDGFKKLKMLGGFNILTKKPVVPDDEECERNPRARSAKLRVAEKIG
jgi:16S rRNA (cytosine1402-N4)-methyltransferase